MVVVEAKKQVVGTWQKSTDSQKISNTSFPHLPIHSKTRREISDSGENSEEEQGRASW
jgi:hypothetical protein